jgi:hypothetical protein
MLRRSTACRDCSARFLDPLNPMVDYSIGFVDGGTIPPRYVSERCVDCVFAMVFGVRQFHTRQKLADIM